MKLHVVVCCEQLKEKHLRRQIDLLRTQKDTAEDAVRTHEEELDEKSEFLLTYIRAIQR